VPSAARYVEVGNHYLQTFGGKRQRGGAANTGGGAGDQGNLAGKRHAHGGCPMGEIAVGRV